MASDAALVDARAEVGAIPNIARREAGGWLVPTAAALLVAALPLVLSPYGQDLVVRIAIFITRSCVYGESTAGSSASATAALTGTIQRGGLMSVAPPRFARPATHDPAKPSEHRGSGSAGPLVLPP